MHILNAASVVTSPDPPSLSLLSASAELEAQTRRRLASIAAGHLSTDAFSRHRAARMADCGLPVETATRTSRFLCGTAGCPFCWGGRYGRYTWPLIKRISNYTFSPGSIALHLVTTIQNVEVNGLREGLKQLTDAWAIMMRRVPFKHALGSLRSQEFTMKNGEFHPHVHAVVIAADLAQAEKMRTLLLEKFQGAAGLTYTPHCYRKGFFAVSSGCDVSGLLRYVLERPEVPVMEALIADREVYTRFHSALLGRRLISATGCFRKSAASKRTASAGTSGSSLVN